MKKIVLLLLVITANTLASSAQEKIKGNKEVTFKQTYVDSFSTVIIKNNLKVKTIYNSKASVEVEADSNLHDFIDIDITAGVLTLSTTATIKSKKKLEITVNYTDVLENITLHNKAEINSLSSLNLNNLSVNLNDHSEANLNINSKIFQLNTKKKSKSELIVRSDSIALNAKDDSKTNLNLNSKISNVTATQNANITLKGYSKTSFVNLDNSSLFKGKEFISDNAEVDIKNKSKIIINISKLLNLRASGKSDTYLYGAPKIELEVFTDTAKLQKKQ